MLPIPRTYTMLAYASSATTSNPVYIGDARQLSLSLTTVAASVVTLQGTNNDLFTMSQNSATWSTMSVFAASGIFAIQPGAMWCRIGQAASNSSATAILSKVVA